MAIFTLLTPFKGAAQPYVDVLNLKYRSFPTETGVENSNMKMKGNMMEAGFMLPMELKNKNYVLVGGDYSQLNFCSTGANASTYSLYSTSLMLGYDQQLKNAAWRRTVLFIPKINGDYKGLDKSFQAGAVVMYTFKKKDNLKYHFGMYYNSEFFGAYFLPLVGIDWKINSKFNLFGDMPSNLSLEMKMNNSLKLGAGFVSTIGSYRIHDQSGVSYIREGDKTFGHNQVKLYLSYSPAKSITLFGEVGETIFRKYSAYASDHTLISTGNITSADGVFITGGIAYRVATE